MSLLSSKINKRPLDEDEEDEVEERPHREGPRPEIGGAILAVDIGSVHTRAILLDMIDGMYRFVARGESPTTAIQPWNNVLPGVQQAILEITRATGRPILDTDGQLIAPERADFSGVNGFMATASAGKPVRAVLVGLMPDVSLSSGRRAAESTYLNLVDTISLGDRRTQEQQINALIQAHADLVLVVGGTDSGAVESMKKQIETVALACSLLEREHRPVVLYAGNKALQQEVVDYFDELGAHALVADNVRPLLETEKLDGAQAKLASLYHRQRTRTTGGYAEVGSWTDDGIFPTAHGFGQMIHILGRLWHENILGVDLGSSDTTVAAYLGEHHYLNVMDGLGMGYSATGILSQVPVDALLRWLSFTPENPDQVQDSVWNRWLFPQTIPADLHELEIGYALAREVMRSAVSSARASWGETRQRGPLPAFDTILLSGSTLTRAPHDGWGVLAALDALQPLGSVRLKADVYGIAASLGAVADLSPRAVVQVLDSNVFLDLGTVISVSGRARKGEIVLRGSLKPDGGQAQTFEVTYGSIGVIPLGHGQAAELSLQPSHVEVETTGGRKLRRLRVSGGELGLIVDARGRPLRSPREADERQALIREWVASLTGSKLGS